ncbi:MAG: ABC transporter substrate-binding protein [Myxococcales bacterium]|nr:ABC transporter substrate-binding protein [Myxococcales bacterium]
MKKWIAIGTTLLALVGCTKTEAPAPTKDAPKAAEAAPAFKFDKGVDAANKRIRIGTLNDESGPAAAIGKPFAIGKRILAAQINAGGTKLLPEGWTIELIEKDHGYDPGKAQQSYNAIKDDILLIGTSFGTPATLPLRPFLEKDGIVAFPASLSSQIAENAYTPPVGPPYTFEAMRAMDWAVEQAGGAANVKAGIIYDQTDYGKDGLDGWKAAAAHHGVTLVADRAIKPGQKDFTAEVAALKEAGATHVLMTILPSSTGPVLGTAAQMQFAPIWIGQTPSWVDAFFAHPKLPPPVFATFYWVNGLPFWGEKLPGMDAFLAAYEKHGKDLGKPDFYTLMSYVQGLVEVEAARRAIEAGDITRAGYMKALRSIDNFDGGGIMQPINLTKVPYVTGRLTRILQPDFEAKTWKSIADYAEPKAAGAPAAPTEAAPPAEAAPAEAAPPGE